MRAEASAIDARSKKVVTENEIEKLLGALSIGREVA